MASEDPTSGATVSGSVPALSKDSLTAANDPPKGSEAAAENSPGHGGDPPSAADSDAAIVAQAQAELEAAELPPVKSATIHYGAWGSEWHHQMALKLQALRDHPAFQSFIILIILVASVQVGVTTYDIEDPTAVAALSGLDTAVLAVFIAEIVIKIAAEGNQPISYFFDGWNLFDFMVVLLSLLPIGGGSAITILRLVRLLRVLKLVRALPKLRILVMGLLQSLSSIGYIGIMLGMMFYLYAVLGVSLFGDNDPLLFGQLHIALLSLFRVATLDNWSAVMRTTLMGCEEWGYVGREYMCLFSYSQPLVGVFYFLSFVVLANMMILNLFIGVITTSMNDARHDLTLEMLQLKAMEARHKRMLAGLPEEEEETVENLDEELSKCLAKLNEHCQKAQLDARETTELFYRRVVPPGSGTTARSLRLADSHSSLGSVSRTLGAPKRPAQLVAETDVEAEAPESATELPGVASTLSPRAPTELPPSLRQIPGRSPLTVVANATADHEFDEGSPRDSKPTTVARVSDAQTTSPPPSARTSQKGAAVAADMMLPPGALPTRPRSAASGLQTDAATPTVPVYLEGRPLLAPLSVPPMASRTGSISSRTHRFSEPNLQSPCPPGSEDLPSPGPPGRTPSSEIERLPSHVIGHIPPLPSELSSRSFLVFQANNVVHVADGPPHGASAPVS